MNFWERRRAAVDAEARSEAAALAQAERAEREEALAEKSDEELLAELDLPDPDTLGAEDDFKAFLAEGIPARLKTRALRRLWRVNPVLANLDGLLDYGEDFTDAATVVENMQTAYQVGKGMLKHVEEMARQAELRDAPDAAKDTDGDAPDALAMADETGATPTDMRAEPDIAVTPDRPETPAADRPAEIARSGAGADTGVDTGVDAELAMPLPSRRRMTFSFQDTTA